MLLIASSPMRPPGAASIFEFGTANSPKKPRRLLACSQFVKLVIRSRPTVALTTSEPPDPLLSRYWCTSNAKLLAGSVIDSIACALGVPYQLSLQLLAPVQAFPGTKTRLLAPVPRIALIATWAA